MKILFKPLTLRVFVKCLGEMSGFEDEAHGIKPNRLFGDLFNALDNVENGLIEVDVDPVPLRQYCELFKACRDYDFEQSVQTVLTSINEIEKDLENCNG
ncbi:hypothetical protein [uncultured Deefgea sp.]|uniref:hypothetical protein n=1 Tax=uncultured Deefgea sp. TaxID=1304914 RepID=UPI002620DB51|nr:hypothetical protein [uncultured Deefgea sp.]